MTGRTVALAEVAAAAVEDLRAAGVPAPDVEARRILEEVTGHAGAEWHRHLDDPITRRQMAAVQRLVPRRAAGEPLQYVLGSWAFRALDLFVDRRVLIPRPETEQVVEHALDAAAALPGRGPMLAVDLGTGSGAIALSLAAELPARTGREVAVRATDRSPDALAVARANLAGAGRSATRVRLLEGDWYGALDPTVAGEVDLVVANPPYVAAGEPLPPEVADWEPEEALVAGPAGTEAIAAVVAGAPAWLRRPGLLVVEVGPHQAAAAAQLARDAGFGDVEVRPDLAGRERALLAVTR